MTLLVAPTQWNQSLADTDPLQCTALLCREGAIGLALGMAVLLLAGGIAIAGDAIGNALGIRAAWNQDDAGNAEAAGRMLELFTFAILLAAGGHRVVIDALLATFQSLPVGESETVSLRSIVDLAAYSFSFGLRASAPVVVAAIAAQIMLAMLGRSQPLLRHAAIGSSSTVLIGVGVWLLSLGAVGLLAMDELQMILTSVRDILIPSVVG
jgi:flagellar biosynthetic protein FliR